MIMIFILNKLLTHARVRQHARRQLLLMTITRIKAGRGRIPSPADSAGPHTRPATMPCTRIRMRLRAFAPVPALLLVAATLAAEDSRTPPAPLAGGGASAGSSALAADIGASVGGVIDHALRTLKWGAYGELHYNNFQGSDSHTGSGSRSTGRDMLELHRVVLLGEAQLHDQWRFVTEIEIEHVFVQNNQGYLAVEQAYLDWQYHPRHSARAGVMLIPISIDNLYHEPTLFHGVERPEFARIIIPTTWFDGGVQVQGEVVEGLDYTFGAYAGLSSAGTGTAPSAGSVANQGVRSWRQQGLYSAADDIMYVGRLDWRPLNGLWLAGAYAYSEVNQDQQLASPNSVVQLYTLEARYAYAGWDLGVSFAQGRISKADEYAQQANGAVPEVFTGINATAAYDVLRLVADTTHQLFVFGRYEWLQNQDEVPAGRTANEAWNADIRQFGLTYKPNPHVVLKADYRDYDNETETAVDSWNLGAGFAF